MCPYVTQNKPSKYARLENYIFALRSSAAA